MKASKHVRTSKLADEIAERIAIDISPSWGYAATAAEVGPWLGVEQRINGAIDALRAAEDILIAARAEPPVDARQHALMYARIDLHMLAGLAWRRMLADLDADTARASARQLQPEHAEG